MACPSVRSGSCWPREVEPSQALPCRWPGWSSGLPLPVGDPRPGLGFLICEVGLIAGWGGVCELVAGAVGWPSCPSRAGLAGGRGGSRGHPGGQGLGFPHGSRGMHGRWSGELTLGLSYALRASVPAPCPVGPSSVCPWGAWSPAPRGVPDCSLSDCRVLDSDAGGEGSSRTRAGPLVAGLPQAAAGSHTCGVPASREAG